MTSCEAYPCKAPAQWREDYRAHLCDLHAEVPSYAETGWMIKNCTFVDAEVPPHIDLGCYPGALTDGAWNDGSCTITHQFVPGGDGGFARNGDDGGPSYVPPRRELDANPQWLEVLLTATLALWLALLFPFLLVGRMWRTRR